MPACLIVRLFMVKDAGKIHIRASLFFRRHVIVSSLFLRIEKVGYEPLQASSMRLTNSQRRDAAVGFKIMRGSSVEGL
jgi:hypothetical protein